MALLRVLKYGNPLLRKQAEPVAIINDSIKKLVEDMIDTMGENEGIGLAAPQVGISIMLFTIDMSLIEEQGKPMAIINPKILDTLGESTFEEGCLSFPEIREEVKRPEIIRVVYQDIDDNQHDEEFGGLKARVFQHEIDHLHGVLLADRIGTIRKKLIQRQLKSITAREQEIMSQEL
jgi:peptide deformylase